MSKLTGISRRTVLRGMGGLVALPWLEIMGRTAFAANARGKDPARMACFYIPGAINHYNWFPADEGPSYTPAR